MVTQTYAERGRGSHPWTKVTDEQLLSAWDDLKQGKYVTLTEMSVSLGYSPRSNAVSRRLKELVSKESYDEALANQRARRYPKETARVWFEKYLKSGRPLRELQIDGAPHYATMGRRFRDYFPVEYEDAVEAKSGKGYQIGRAFEYRCRDALRARGYVVFRSPRSLSAADLVALRAGTILMIQCKTRRDSMTKKERLELLAMARAAGGRAVFAWRGRRGTGIVWEDLSGEPFSLD